MSARTILVALLAAALVMASGAAWAATEALTVAPDHEQTAVSVSVEGQADEQTGEPRAIQETIWFQGFVADPGTGEPINASHSVVARIYSAEFGGTSLWGPETHNSTQINDGWFNIELGSIVSPLPPFDDPPYYLQLWINGESLDPRLKLASVPSAFQSLSSDGGGGGLWTEVGANIYRASGDVGVGVAVPQGKFHVQGGTGKGGLFWNSGTYMETALRAANPVGSAAAFTSGVDPEEFWYTTTPSAVFGRAEGGGTGGLFEATDAGVGLYTLTHGSGAALYSWAIGSGRSGHFSGGEGVEISSPGLYGLNVTASSASSSTRPIFAEFTATGSYDAVAIEGVCTPADYWGIGGRFTGGWRGVEGLVYPSGGSSYYGVRGYVSGGGGYNYGVYGSASGGAASYAGYFAGNAIVTGTLSKGAGSFRIDHPLDPANKYLYHSFVESPDMMNVYNGNVELDGAGEAWIEMPEWFGVLNRDFRYQLTCIGGFAPVYVAEKISGNRFKIAGGEPGMEVSWQVTGIRQDKFAEENRIPVEEMKPPRERGKYIHPAAFGLPESAGIDYDKNTEGRK